MTSAAVQYQVRWRKSTDADTSWSAPAAVGADGQLAVPGLSNVGDYVFQARARAGCGAWSAWAVQTFNNPAPAYPPPSLPDVDGAPDGIHIDFGQDQLPADQWYEIQRAPDVAGVPGEWATIAKTQSTVWDDVVTDTAAYWYRFRIVDFDGTASDWTPLSSPVSASVSTPAISESFNELRGDFQGTLDDLSDAIGDASGLADSALAQVQQEVIDRAAAISAEANARATAILNEQNARVAAVSAEQATRQTADDSLATQISLVSAGSGEQFDSAKIWYFDSDLEAWTGNGTPAVVDGWLRPANDPNPLVTSPAGLAINGGSYRFVKARIKKVGNPTWRGHLKWRTASGDWSAAVIIPEPSYDANGVTAVAWGDIAWWPNTIDRFLLALGGTQSDTDYFLIDWIAVGRPTPGAGVALVQEETAARVQADSQEATQRTTLATQMRGAYTGTDVAQVTSGLIYSEQQARSSADSALATRTSTLEARMPTGAGKLATAASVTDEATARANADTALSTRTGTIEARMPTGSGVLATAASVTSLQNAQITQSGGNAIPNGNGQDGTTAPHLVTAGTLNVVQATASNTAGGSVRPSAVLGPLLQFTGTLGTAGMVYYSGAAYSPGGAFAETTEGEKWIGSVWLGDFGAGINIGTTVVRLQFRQRDGTYIGQVTQTVAVPNDGDLDKIELSGVAPAGAGRVNLAITFNMDGSGTQALLQNPLLVRDGAANSPTYQATAQDVSAIQTRMPAGSGELATSAALSSLSGTVTQQGQTITSQGQALTAVQSQTMDAGNLVAKAYFDDGDVGPWANALASVVTTTDSAMPGRVLKIGAVSLYLPVANAFSVKPGETFDVSCLMSAYSVASAQPFQNIQWLDKDGAVIGYAGTGTPAWAATAGQGGRLLSFVATAPAGAASARPGFSNNGMSGGDYILVTAITVKRRTTQAAQTASAVQQLTTNVSTGGKTYAQATTLVDANGRIAGTRLASDGSTTSFDVLADRFSVSSQAGGAHTEYSDGNWRVYDANNVLRVRMGVW